MQHTSNKLGKYSTQLASSCQTCSVVTMSSTFQLLEVLRKVKNPGNFAAGGFADFPDNLVCFHATPLPITRELDAKAIISRCSQAPYGRGRETIVDTSVRKTWQLDPSEISIASRKFSCLWNKRWQTSLAALVDEVSVDLGCPAGQDVTCELYKFLLYEPGGFFKRHRDTEKVDGMFGTLVLQLPSYYKGGQLIVHHQGEKKIFDYSDKPWKCYYTAFYADCEHEICEITEGYRLCLIYNLISKAKVPLPIPAEDNSEAVAQVVKIVKEWAADDKGPSMMTHLLDHKYCDASLSFSALKNKDRAVADLLMNARKQFDFEIYLTIVTKNEQWISSNSNMEDHVKCCYSYSPDCKCGHFEMDEFESSSLIANDSLITPSGNREQLSFKFNRDSLEREIGLEWSTLNAMADIEKLETTGNQGATLEMTYFQAVLIVCPVRKK